MEQKDDWLHTEILGNKQREPLVTLTMIVMLLVAIVLLIIAFRGLFLPPVQKTTVVEKQEEEIPLPPKVEKKESQKEEKQAIYIVEPGDTLSSIGAKFNIDWQDIAKANGLEEPYELQVGQELIIPGVAPEALTETEEKEEEKTQKEGQVYIVQEGDTLSLIGEKFGVPWEKIAEANNLEEPYLLSVGQELIIPQE